MNKKDILDYILSTLMVIGLIGGFLWFFVWVLHNIFRLLELLINKI